MAWLSKIWGCRNISSIQSVPIFCRSGRWRRHSEWRLSECKLWNASGWIVLFCLRGWKQFGIIYLWGYLNLAIKFHRRDFYFDMYVRSISSDIRKKLSFIAVQQWNQIKWYFYLKVIRKRFSSSVNHAIIARTKLSMISYNSYGLI